MKNTKRSLVLLLVFVILSAIISGCGSNAPKSLSGRYVSEGSTPFSYIEFFSDGKYTSSHSNYEGNYSIDGNRIRLEGILVDSKIYYFRVHGNTLEMDYDEDFDDPDVYVKK